MYYLVSEKFQLEKIKSVRAFFQEGVNILQTTHAGSIYELRESECYWRRTFSILRALSFRSFINWLAADTSYRSLPKTVTVKSSQARRTHGQCVRPCEASTFLIFRLLKAPGTKPGRGSRLEVRSSLNTLCINSA